MAAIHVDPREHGADEIESPLTEDDWIFDSIKSYKHLHMYELQNIPTAIDFVNKEAICISCQRKDGGSEILELHIPDRLLATKEILSKDRDFSVISGGFHNKPITGIYCLHATRNFVTTEENDNSIGVWCLGSDRSDMWKFKSRIKSDFESGRPVQACLLKDNSKMVAFGSCLKDLTLADVNSEKVFLTSNQSQEGTSEGTIEHLSFVDDHTLFIMSENGQVWLMDTRENGQMTLTFPKVMTPEVSSDVKVTWSCDTKQQTFVRINDQGQGHFGDIRNSKSTKKFNFPMPRRNSDIGKTKVKISPHSDTFSLSGLNGNIELFDILNRKDSDEHLSPIFTHRGHSACSEATDTVTMATAWYPWQQNLIFSAANDGSLHAWNYICDPKVVH